MPEATLADIQREIAGIHALLVERDKTAITPMKEELTRMGKLILSVQEAERATRRAALYSSPDRQRQLVQSGRYTGMSRLDMAIVKSLMNKQSNDLQEPGIDGSRRAMLEKWKANCAAALDSTTTALGDELVPTAEARELWMDVNLETIMLPLIPRITMPTNPFDIPLQFGGVNFYPGTQNVATKSTAPATAKNTLNAYELVGEVPWSYDLDEDSVVAMMPAMREHLTREVAHIIDDVIINGDTTTTNNINADGATIAATDAGKGQWLLGFDGIIHQGLIDNTAMAVDVNAAIADTTISSVRKLLAKYGVRPSDCCIVSDIRTWLAAQTLTNLRTLDKFGPQATILTGQLGAFDGIPWLVSEDMLLAASDGKVTDGTAGTTGRILVFNKSQWTVGFKREVSMETVRDVQKRQHIVVVSFRMGLLTRGTRVSNTHTGIAYNITGV